MEKSLKGIDPHSEPTKFRKRQGAANQLSELAKAKFDLAAFRKIRSGLEAKLLTLDPFTDPSSIAETQGRLDELCFVLDTDGLLAELRPNTHGGIE